MISTSLAYLAAVARCFSFASEDFFLYQTQEGGGVAGSLDAQVTCHQLVSETAALASQLWTNALLNTRPKQPQQPQQPGSDRCALPFFSHVRLSVRAQRLASWLNATPQAQRSGDVTVGCACTGATSSLTLRMVLATVEHHSAQRPNMAGAREEVRVEPVVQEGRGGRRKGTSWWRCSRPLISQCPSRLSKSDGGAVGGGADCSVFLLSAADGRAEH